MFSVLRTEFQNWKTPLFPSFSTQLSARCSPDVWALQEPDAGGADHAGTRGGPEGREGAGEDGQAQDNDWDTSGKIGQGIYVYIHLRLFKIISWKPISNCTKCIFFQYEEAEQQQQQQQQQQLSKADRRIDMEPENR